MARPGALTATVDPVAGHRPIRVMLVDDSAVARAILARMIAADPRFEIAAAAASAAEAARLLESSQVDIVLLDLEMPGASGLDALPELAARGRGARILVLSASCEEGGMLSEQALSRGAADTLTKPGATAFAGSFSEVLTDRLARLGHGAAAPRQDRPEPAASSAAVSLRPLPRGDIACLALGASTGGIQALTAFLVALPPHVDVPILITQHLPPFFVPYFAAQIEACSGRRVRLGVDGMELEPGAILIAPGDADLGLDSRNGAIRISVNRQRRDRPMPSVDHMLASAGEAFGSGALGIVFTGIGRDGLEGSASLVDCGGAVLVQDRESSAVWGMPRAVAEAGLASAMLPPAALARCVGALAGAASWS